MLRPFHRLWLFESSDAPAVSWLESKEVQVLQEIKNKDMKARLLQHQGVQPMAWPSVKGCQLSEKRRSWTHPSGRLQTTELEFDGRFAWGQKVTVKSKNNDTHLPIQTRLYIGRRSWVDRTRATPCERWAQLRSYAEPNLARTLSDQSGLDGVCAPRMPKARS